MQLRDIGYTTRKKNKTLNGPMKKNYGAILLTSDQIKQPYPQGYLDNHIKMYNICISINLCYIHTYINVIKNYEE